jgi:DeoR/GlpR family transcriptional regulator of sugar metabolism
MNSFSSKGRGFPVSETNHSFPVEPGLLPAKRHYEVLALLRKCGHMRVQEIAERFHISPDTARRDLGRLARQGLLTRTFGGAVAGLGPAAHASAFSPSVPESGFNRIARVAAGLIDEGETLAVGGGRLCTQFAACLTLRRLTVVTNNLEIPSVLPEHVSVYVLGGRHQRRGNLTIGAMLVSDASLSVETSILSADGISLDAEIAMSTPEQALIARRMLDASQRCLILAEAAFFGKQSLARVRPNPRKTLLITDQRPPASISDALAKAGVSVIVAQAPANQHQ